MKGRYINPLQELQLSEHNRWIDKACDINIEMQKHGKPKDLPLGASIVDYALDRLMSEVIAKSEESPEQKKPTSK